MAMEQFNTAVLRYNIFEKSGSWIAYNNEKIGQGRDAVRLFLKENPKLLDEIESKVKEKLLVGTAVPAGGEEEGSKSDDE